MAIRPDIFWSRVRKTDLCWLWEGYLLRGYGRYGWPPKSAHRVAYELLVGPIPAGLELDHLCRNTRCVNPDHLEAVTQRENNRRSNSPPSVNARKTHCNNGHEFTEENTIRVPSKPQWRECRTCKNALNLAVYYRR